MEKDRRVLERVLSFLGFLENLEVFEYLSGSIQVFKKVGKFLEVWGYNKKDIINKIFLIGSKQLRLGDLVVGVNLISF